MRWVVRSVLLVVLAWPGVASAAEWIVESLPIPGGVSSIFDDGGRTIVESRGGSYFALAGIDRGVRLERLGAYKRPVTQRRPDMLPDGGIAMSDRNVREAYLINPTSRYRHGVLGDSIEAAGVRVLTGDGETLDLVLDSDSVFEDLSPRVHDIDRDGLEELVLVRSFVDSGASVVVVAPRGGALEIVAASESIGRSNRWLNPVGVADFDGDGQQEIAVVRTPHIGGILMLYRQEGADLVVDHQVRGFSNHFIGSRELGMAHIGDFNLDGVADIALPNADRDTLRLVAFLGGAFAEVASIPLSARVRTGLHGVADAGGAVAFGLADGTLAILKRK